MYVVPGPVRNLMKTASTDNNVAISWNPPEPSDGYNSVTYTIRYGVLGTPGEVINTQNTQESINSLGNDIMRVKCSYYILFHTFCQHTIEPGIPYYVAVSAGTTGGNGNETEIIVFSKEEGCLYSYTLYVHSYNEGRKVVDNCLHVHAVFSSYDECI